MITASCLCHAIKWQFKGEFSQITHCHCSLCRKAHGSAYATYGLGSKEKFEYLEGTESIFAYESSPQFFRSFCRHCGSVVPNTKLGDIVAMPIGGADGDLNITIDAHIYVANKAPWHEITDGLPQHDYYPGQDKPVVAVTNHAAVNAASTHGSCLCGAVAFELTAPFTVVRNCHCVRCRKARAAAYATNGLSEINALQFTSGHEYVKEYRLPGAKYFGQCFCSRCGSAMPRIDAGRNVALTPFGALDSDPGQRAEHHIFVGSKANWDVITDQLPQFEEMPS